MNNFQFFCPTRVFFGRAIEESMGEHILSFRPETANVMVVHYEKESEALKNLVERVKAAIEKAGLKVVDFNGARPNPVLGSVRRGIACCIEQQVDLIVAVGGGSSIDTAKAISLGAANPEEDVWDFFLKVKTPKKRIPVAAFVTTAAAGSEMSNSCVLTNEEGDIKRGLGLDLNRPVAAFMNPEVLFTVPPYQTACGICDIMMHTMERYFTPEEGNELTEGFAETLLRDVIKNGRLLYKDPRNYQAASEILWCGSVSHNGMTGFGVTEDWGTHQMGHELSGKYNKAHGATITAMWGHWARYVYSEHSEKFKNYAVRVWDTEFKGSIEETALKGIETTERFFKELGMPVSIPELIGRKLTDEEIRDMSEKCTFFGKRTIGSLKVLGAGEIREIYAMANQ